MPCRKGDYPEDWREVSKRIRYERADGRCECEGECGLHHGRRCIERDREPAVFANGVVMLTVAHLDADGDICTCRRDTGRKCGREDHLKAMCQRCHCRIDVTGHVENARRTRLRKRLAQQPCLEIDGVPAP